MSVEETGKRIIKDIIDFFLGLEAKNALLGAASKALSDLEGLGTGIAGTVKNELSDLKNLTSNASLPTAGAEMAASSIASGSTINSSNAAQNKNLSDEANNTSSTSSDDSNSTSNSDNGKTNSTNIENQNNDSLNKDKSKSNIPILAQFFSVHIEGITKNGDSEQFSSIEGLGKYVSSSQTYSAGDEINTNFLAEKSTTRELIFSRPLTQGKSDITQWCINSIGSEKNREYKNIMIFLQNIEGDIVAQWKAIHAIPKDVSTSSITLKSEDMLIQQKIVFICKDLEFETKS